MTTAAKDVATRAHRADLKLARKAAETRSHPAIRAAAAVGELADQPPLIALCAGTIAAGGLLRDARLVRAGGRMLASHLLATAIKTVLKRSIDRTRPRATQEGKPYRLAKGGDNGHDLASFPSGHTAGAVAVARALARDYPGSAPAAALAATGVAAIQLPNAKHYASDVAAGAAIGLASEWVVGRAAQAIGRSVTSWKAASVEPAFAQPHSGSPRAVLSAPSSHKPASAPPTS